MSAKVYSINFPYGATSYPYSVSSPHRGNDRPCPTGTPIVIGNTTIGWTGSTGWATGPHLHTQAGTDMYAQRTVNPAPYEFQPGKVVAKGWGDQWGNYVIIQVGSHYICYAHLSQTNVSVGQVINATPLEGGNAVDTIKSMYWRLLGREADQSGIDTYTKVAGTKGWQFVYTDLKNSPEGQRDWDRRNPTRVKRLETEVHNKNQTIANLQTALANEQNKPPREVVKEVEKIVELEVIREVQVGEEEAVRGFFGKLLDLIFKK